MATSPSHPPGFDPSTLSSHLTRSAAREASHVTPHITSSSHILDIGCGPGSITCDFAALAPDGQVTGIDRSESAITTARQLASGRKLTNIAFQAADVYRLPFADDTFDIVHCNAVLVHLAHPVAALREMRRVCKSGGQGRVAVRESDWDSYVVHPLSGPLKRCGEVMRHAKVAQGMEPNAGRHLAQWAGQAGFNANGVELECDVVHYFGSRDVGYWGDDYARRMRSDGARDLLVRGGIVSEAEMEEWAMAWSEWGRTEGAVWAVLHMRMVAVK